MSDQDAEKVADEMRPEYDSSGGTRAKHFRAYHEARRVLIHRKDGTTEERDFVLPEGTVILDPDLRARFPDSESVNRALRHLTRRPTSHRR